MLQLIGLFLGISFLTFLNKFIFRKEVKRNDYDDINLSKDDLIDYQTFNEKLSKRQIEKIIVDPVSLNCLNFAFEGLMTIKIKLKDQNRIVLLPIMSVNNFLKNLEKIQKKQLLLKEKQYVQVEFLRPTHRKQNLNISNFQKKKNYIHI